MISNPNDGRKIEEKFIKIKIVQVNVKAIRDSLVKVAVVTMNQ